MNLYPRESSSQHQRARAHRILDAARAGQHVSAELITWALRITGDLS